jgi:hypothetical protein
MLPTDSELWKRTMEMTEKEHQESVEFRKNIDAGERLIIIIVTVFIAILVLS